MTSWSRGFKQTLKSIIIGIVFAVIRVIILAVGVGFMYLGLQNYLSWEVHIKITAWIDVPIAVFGFVFNSIGF